MIYIGLVAIVQDDMKKLVAYSSVAHMGFVTLGFFIFNTAGVEAVSYTHLDLTKCIFCGFCEESCPVDSIVETHIHEYHGEKRGDLYFTKDMLLAVGDRYEAEIARRRAEDAPYR